MVVNFADMVSERAGHSSMGELPVFACRVLISGNSSLSELDGELWLPEKSQR